MEISMDRDHFEVLMKAIKNQTSLSKGNLKRSERHSEKHDQHQKEICLLYHLEQEFNYNFSF